MVPYPEGIGVVRCHTNGVGADKLIEDLIVWESIQFESAFSNLKLPYICSINRCSTRRSDEFKAHSSRIDRTILWRPFVEQTAVPQLLPHGHNALYSPFSSKRFPHQRTSPHTIVVLSCRIGGQSGFSLCRHQTRPRRLARFPHQQAAVGGEYVIRPYSIANAACTASDNSSSPALKLGAALDSNANAAAGAG